MADIKDKVVTVESLSALHEYNKNEYVAKNDVISVAKGGTGATNIKEVEYNISGNMPEGAGAMNNDTQFVCKYVTPTNTSGVFYYRTIETFWNYIVDKIRSVFKFNDSNVLQISNGGTGATSSKVARENLGVDKAYLLDSVGTAINASDNLNNYTTAGIYYAVLDVATTLTNSPVAVGFKLVVEYGYSGSNRIIQTIHTGTANGATYTRKLVDNVWSPWINPLTNVLTPNDYGTALPTAGTAGRIYFKKLNS